MQITATQMIAHHSINYILIRKSSKMVKFNKRIISGKHFKAIAVMVYLVDIYVIARIYETQLLE